MGDPFLLDHEVALCPFMIYMSMGNDQQLLVELSIFLACGQAQNVQ